MSDQKIGLIVAVFVVGTILVTLVISTVVVPNRRDRRWLLAKRADEQHAQFCRDDPLGIYGSYQTVANMQIITDWKADE